MIDYQVALTTVDNPFDPFDDFVSWFLYDSTQGHNSPGYLARVARTSDQLTDEENIIETERAIDEIIKYDFMNIYKKIKKPLVSSKEQEHDNPTTS